MVRLYVLGIESVGGVEERMIPQPPADRKVE
jgi:hypothetical protein